MVSDMCLRAKIEGWFLRGHVSYTRFHNVRISRVCKSFSNKNSDEKLLMGIEVAEHEKSEVEKSKRFSRKWKSMQIRKERKPKEEQTSPILPEVLKTYDKGTMQSAEELEMDDAEVVRYQYQLFNELAIKKDQVKQLRSEVDTINLNNFELKRSLDVAKCESKEKDVNLNLALKRINSLEELLQKKNEAVVKTRVQQDSIVGERDTLRELLRTSELKNYEISRQLEELQIQDKCNISKQNELKTQNQKIVANMTKISGAMQNLKTDQKQIFEMYESVKKMKDLKKMLDFYKNRFDQIEKTNHELEQQYLMARSEANMLISLAKANHSSTLLLEQEKRTQHFENKSKELQDQIDHLQQDIEQMRIVNEKLFLEQLSLEETNSLLTKQLNVIKCDIAIQTDDIDVKTEIIELN